MSKWGSVFLVLVLGVAISLANPGHYVHDYYKHGMGEEVRNNIFHETEMKKGSLGRKNKPKTLRKSGQHPRICKFRCCFCLQALLGSQKRLVHTF